MNALLPIEPVVAPAVRAEPDQILAVFLRGRAASTVRAYSTDLKHFAGHQSTSPEKALAGLLRLQHGEANEAAHAYRASMVEAGLAPNTINRRLATLRSLTSLARTFGWISWKLEVPSVRTTLMRDTRGPGTQAIAMMIALAGSNRDRLILRLLFDRALRRGEVHSLNVQDYDRGQKMLWVVGKGYSEREGLTLPEPTAKALEAWLEERGSEPGPLITNKRGGRLSLVGIWAVVKKAGAAAGLEKLPSPHGLRHSAITRAAEILNGNVVDVQRFSRHSDVRTVMVYVDRVQDTAGETASAVARATSCQGCGKNISEGYLCGSCEK